MEPFAPVVEQYADFVSFAEDGSPCFAAWARGVVGDPEVAAWLGALPQVKQQPNLVFAAARWHGVPAPGPYAALREALLGDDGAIRATILARATQTNEAGRLATLTPVFAHLSAGRPLALLEVGASAGLCLYPDRWGYDWDAEEGTVRAGPAHPRLRCEVTGPAPLPTTLPTVAWRGGVDLNPLDVTDDRPDGDMAWLTTLVWPEHHDRREQLARAIEVARDDPPTLVRGDLLSELPALVEQAAAYGPVVVFHSAVLAYAEAGERARFQAMMADLVRSGACHWVSNEGPRVLPAVTATGPEVPPARFVLGLDGRAVAWTQGHGRTLAWLPEPS